jgi:hypothetical protein
MSIADVFIPMEKQLPGNETLQKSLRRLGPLTIFQTDIKALLPSYASMEAAPVKI